MNSFKPTGLCMLMHELGIRRPNFGRAFLKDNKVLAYVFVSPVSSILKYHVEKMNI